MSTFNIEDYQKSKGVTQTRLQQNIRDALGRGAEFYLEDFLKDLQEKSSQKSDKQGIVGDILTNIFGEKGGKTAKGLFKMFSSLNPVTAAINFADTLIENQRKQKDYETTIKQLEQLGLKIPEKFKNTFAENPLTTASAQGAGEAIDIVSDTKQVEKTLGTIDAILAGLPVAKNISAKVAPNLGQNIADYTGAGVGALTGSEKLGEITTDAISKTGSLASKLTSPSRIGGLPGIKYGSPIQMWDNPAFQRYVNLPSVSSFASAFRPGLTEMLLEEPGDITMKEIAVPKIRRRRT